MSYEKTNIEIRRERPMVFVPHVTAEILLQRPKPRVGMLFCYGERFFRLTEAVEGGFLAKETELGEEYDPPNKKEAPK